MLLNAQAGFGANAHVEVEATVNAVAFDGANDYLTRGADLTGNANSKLWTGSIWWRMDASPASTFLYWATNESARVILSASAFDLYVFAKDTSGNLDLGLQSSVGYNDTDWHNTLWSVDMSDTNKRHLYVDDVDVLGVLNWADDTLDFTQVEHSIGAKGDGNFKLDGDMAEVWIDFGRYIDFGSEANRRKFISSNKKPIDLGADGSTPTGTSPIIFLSGATGTWHTNKGTGGGFTETGSLTTAGTSPSD